MKKLGLIILLLIPSLLSGQETTIEGLLKSLNNRAEKRGVNLDSLLTIHVDTIRVEKPEFFGDPKNPTLSKVLADAQYLRTVNRKWVWEIRLSSDVMDDFQLAERILGHEIGHTLHVKHCCSEDGLCQEECCSKVPCLNIMGSGHVTDKTNFFYMVQFHPEQSVLFWDEFFNSIKLKNNLQ